jgi:hypothetical protein
MTDYLSAEQLIQEDIVRWGLKETFVFRGWIDRDGVPKLDAFAECPSCYALITVGDILVAISTVEKMIEARHGNWLATILEMWITPGAIARDGTAKILRPSHLQMVLGCTAIEAKNYIEAATALGLARYLPFWESKPVASIVKLYFGVICSDCSGFTDYTGPSRRSVAPRLRREVFFRDKHTCQDCGGSRATNPSIALHVDHIIPVAMGGSNNLDNLQTLCSDCNIGKSDDALYGVLERE